VVSSYRAPSVCRPEPHKMSARVWSGEVTKTKRYELGEKLGHHTRHLLLMTATPHSGKEEDFLALEHEVDDGRVTGAGAAPSS
jgi:hypothetical protein